MYVKTYIKGESTTATGTIDNPAVITDATEGIAFSHVECEIEPIYSGSGTPSLINVRPISSHGILGIQNRYGVGDEDQDVYEVSFGEAGAIYGGTYNANTGRLKVTKVIEVITSVNYRAVYGDNRRFRGFTTRRAKNRGADTYVICDKIEPSYQNVMVAPSSANGIYIAVSTNVSYSFVYILLPSSVANTVAQANNWLAENKPTICYELETPIEYTIDPVQIMAHGSNSIFCNTGVISVTYDDYERTYTDISNLQFAPEVDITTSEVHINEFTVDIVTDDSFVIGREAYLCDNSDNVWAKYYVYSADRTSTDVVRLNAKSILWRLDNRTMYQSMYNEELASTVIARIFRGLDAEYVLDPSFDNVTITGYLPQGSARDRLHDVCFTIGAYINTCFTDKIEILPIDTTATLIPQNKTYWRPSVEYSKYITAIQVEYYDYEERYPSSVDEWVEVNGKYYVKTAKTAELRNPNAPTTAPENIASVSGIGIINEDNVDEVLSRLSDFYFQRIVLTANVIDNGEYVPGEKYTIATGINAEYPMITGYMASALFTFGHQAKAQIVISQSQEVEAVDINISYNYNSTILDTHHMTLPDGHSFTIGNPYLTTQYAVGATVYWTLYYPVNEVASGTAIEGGVYTQPYEIALQHNSSYAQNDLYIYEVDDLEQDGDKLIIKGGEESYE